MSLHTTGLRYLVVEFLQKTVQPRLGHLHGPRLIGYVAHFDQNHHQLLTQQEKKSDLPQLHINYERKTGLASVCVMMRTGGLSLGASQKFFISNYILTFIILMSSKSFSILLILFVFQRTTWSCTGLSDMLTFAWNVWSRTAPQGAEVRQLIVFTSHQLYKSCLAMYYICCLPEDMRQLKVLISLNVKLKTCLFSLAFD